MTEPQTDALGRATFHHIRPLRDVKPTAREIRWLKHIERHGPQSSEFLFELTRSTHRCRDTSLRDMQKLRAGGFVHLPRPQRQTERAEFKPYIYDLTRQGRGYLEALCLSEDALRPTGHWWHGYTVSAFTSSLDIWATRHGREFVLGHKILERRGADLAVPVRNTRVIPDQLFAIGYSDGYRAFMLEVDRGTEPKLSATAQKTLTSSVEFYGDIFASGLHRKHYGLKANVVSLWVFNSEYLRQQFHQIVHDRAGRLARYFLSKTLPEKLSFEDMCNTHKEPWMDGAGTAVDGL